MKISKSLYKGISITLILFIIILSLYRNTGLFYRKKIILPFSLHLNRQDLILIKGEEFRLFVYGINKRVSYRSTNIRVAGVDFLGRVFAYRTGKTYIIAKVSGKKLKCRVRVIDLNKKQLKLSVGETYRLKVKGITDFARYKSSNPKVAKVNIFGKIKAKKPGKTTITVYIKGKVLKCKVTVE
jgi:uncharacterized protein YjdB